MEQLKSWICLTPSEYNEVKDKLSDLIFRLGVLERELTRYVDEGRRSIRPREVMSTIDWCIGVVSKSMFIAEDVKKLLQKGEAR